ncbi:hypothetical protein OVA19_00950, partial [Streptomyces sp. SL203]
GCLTVFAFIVKRFRVFVRRPSVGPLSSDGGAVTDAEQKSEQQKGGGSSSHGCHQITTRGGSDR